VIRLTSQAWCIAAMLIASTAAAPAGSADSSGENELLRKALASFDEAAGLAASDPDRSQALYRDSAAGFEALIRGGARNAAIETNLGNCRFRLGQLGRAILHYRRALALDPTDDRAAANLVYARTRVEPGIEDGDAQRVVERLQFWNRLWSPAGQLWCAAALAAAGWGGLILRLKWRARGLLIGGAACAALSAAWLAAIAWRQSDAAARPHAVVVEGSPTLRQGRGDGYDPVLKQALGPGVELRVIDRRGDWVEVRLGSGVTGWLPAASVQEI